MSSLNRRYEAIVIVHPDLTEEQLSNFEKETAQLIQRHGGELLEKFNLGKRKLSFKIGRFTEGLYLEIRFVLPTAQVGALGKGMVLLEKVIRFMVGRQTLKSAPPVPVGTSAAVPETVL